MIGTQTCTSISQPTLNSLICTLSVTSTASLNGAITFTTLMGTSFTIAPMFNYFSGTIVFLVKTEWLLVTDNLVVMTKSQFSAFTDVNNKTSLLPSSWFQIYTPDSTRAGYLWQNTSTPWIVQTITSSYFLNEFTFSATVTYSFNETVPAIACLVIQSNTYCATASLVASGTARVYITVPPLFSGASPLLVQSVSIQMGHVNGASGQALMWSNLKLQSGCGTDFFVPASNYCRFLVVNLAKISACILAGSAYAASLDSLNTSASTLSPVGFATNALIRDATMVSWDSGKLTIQRGLLYAEFDNFTANDRLAVLASGFLDIAFIGFISPGGTPKLSISTSAPAVLFSFVCVHHSVRVCHISGSVWIRAIHKHTKLWTYKLHIILDCSWNQSGGWSVCAV